METTQKIDRYLSKEMSAAERKQFEQDLKQDAALQRELEAVYMIKEAIQTSALRAQVKQIHAEFIKDYQPEEIQPISQSEAKIVPLRRLKGIVWWGSRVAAAVILLIVSVSSYQYATLTSDEIYAQKYIPYKLPTVRSGNPTDSALDSLYKIGGFGQVIVQATQKRPKQPHDFFLMAMSHLNQNQFEESVELFEKLRLANAERGVKYFEPETDYYEALALLGSRQYDKAHQLFDKIHNDPTHLFHANVSVWDLWKLRILGW